jgi:sulfite exporter TauE/SafE
MLATLLATAVLMGLAGTPHCLAMCGAPCAALTRRPAQQAAWQAARLLAYAGVGALAAASLHTVGLVAQVAPVLRPLWTLLHAAALALGLWLLCVGRQPAWLERLGRAAAPAGPVLPLQRHSGWQRSALAGLAWPAWPCGLLQAALVVAALANSAAGGAAVMAAFAATTGVALWLGPALWWRWAGPRAARANAWAVRGAGLLLAASSAWVLGHGLWQRVAAWCVV